VAAHKEELLATAEKAVKSALQLGAAEAEVFLYSGKATSVGIERGQISKTDRIYDQGAGMRVQVNKAIGFAYTNMPNNSKAIEDVIQKALSAARASKPDPNWKSLPQPKPYPKLPSGVDPKVLALNPGNLVDLASQMLDAAGSDKRVFAIEGGAGAGYAANAIANSNGVVGFDEATMVECSIATLAKEGNTVTPVCFEFNADRKYTVDPVWVGKEAARLTISTLKTNRAQTKTTQVVFTQFALQELLYYTLINALKADNVERNQSPFKDKLGVQVGSEVLSITDDGLLKDGLRTGVFDAEGTPHQTTPLIEKGVLKNYLYVHYTAQKLGCESTGNASRGGYLSTPSIEATNFHIHPGTKTAEQLLAEVDDGLLVSSLQGAHSSNPVSGEFSVVATPAWKINKGNLDYAVKAVMVAGNIFDLLKNISLVGGNERKMGQLVAPWLLVDNVRVIGK
jgi:PmbA protein